MGRGEVKVYRFYVELKVSVYQLKTDCYIYEMFYVRLIVITKENTIADTKKINRKGLKHATNI